MKLAINGATTKPYSLQEDVKAASLAGFQGVEIWWDKGKEYLGQHSKEELCALLSEYNILPAGICPFLVSPFRNTGDRREEFSEALETAKYIGCDLMTVCPDFRPATLSVKEAQARHAEEFAWYADKAAPYGVRLAVEPIGCHTLVPGPAQALEIIEMAGNPDNLGLVLDTFHYMKSGVTEEEIMRIPVDKLYMVHVNDSEEGMAEELGDQNRLYPLKGCIDLRNYKRWIQRLGYDGYYSVEVFRPGYWQEDILTITAEAMKSIQQLLKE